MALKSLFPQLSSGERSFVWAVLSISVLGAVLSCIVVMRLAENPLDSNTTMAFVGWTFIAGCIGGGCGFWFCFERWFGHPGKSGWMSALIGAIAISGLGSVVAGTLILPLYGTMFGPLQLAMMIIEFPMVGIVWFATLLGAHRLLITWREERDSIFARGETH